MLVYQEIAYLMTAIENCKESGNIDWEYKHEEKLDRIIKACLPNGSGFDSGVKLVIDDTTIRNKIVFSSPFHCMDEQGGYADWVFPTIIITPDWQDINLKVNWHGYRGKYKFLLDDMIQDVWYTMLTNTLPDFLD